MTPPLSGEASALNPNHLLTRQNKKRFIVLLQKDIQSLKKACPAPAHIFLSQNRQRFYFRVLNLSEQTNLSVHLNLISKS